MLAVPGAGIGLLRTAVAGRGEVMQGAQTGYNTTSPLLQMGRLLMYRYKTRHKLATTQPLPYSRWGDY